MAATKKPQMRKQATKTATKRAAPRRRPKSVHYVPPPPVELYLSRRCPHGCFYVCCAYHPTVWNVAGYAHEELAAGGRWIVHNHQESELEELGEDVCDCWVDEFDPDDGSES